MQSLLQQGLPRESHMVLLSLLQVNSQGAVEVCKLQQRAPVRCMQNRLRTGCQPLCRKNQALASDDRAAAEIRKPFGEKVLTGEKGFAEHMAGMRQQAQEQGSAQHSDVAHKLKEVGSVFSFYVFNFDTACMSISMQADIGHVVWTGHCGGKPGCRCKQGSIGHGQCQASQHPYKDWGQQTRSSMLGACKLQQAPGVHVGSLHVNALSPRSPRQQGVQLLLLLLLS